MFIWFCQFDLSYYAQNFHYEDKSFSAMALSSNPVSSLLYSWIERGDPTETDTFMEIQLSEDLTDIFKESYRYKVD